MRNDGLSVTLTSIPLLHDKLSIPRQTALKISLVFGFRKKISIFGKIITTTPMKKAALLILISVFGLLACDEKEEKDVCTTCTGYVGSTADTVFSICLTPSTMDIFIEDLYRLNNNANQHFVCTDPK